MCVALLAAVGLILLMGCMNLINLIVARNATRDREIAVRMALGASRLRLLRQLCSESLLLGCLGGIAGLFMSVYACRWLGVKAAAAMDELSRGGMRLGLDLSPDWHTFAWTAAISVLAGTMVGLIPAMSVGKRNLSAALKRSSGFRDPGISRKRNVLVTLQVASCLMLLAGSGLLFRGAARSSGIDPGFDVHHAMLISLDLHTLDRTNVGRAGILDKAIGQMRRVPGVRYVAWADRAPFLGHGTGVFANEAGARLSSVFDGVSEDYFDTLGIPLLAGRRFTRAEVESGAPVATISESTARHLWPGVNAVGQRITALNAERMDAGSAQRTVVGVVKTVRGTHLSKADEGAVYFPRRMPDTYGLLLLRTAGPPENSFRALSAALAGVNASLPTMCNMMTIDETPLKMERWMAEAPAMAAGILGSLAILLACLGLFGVISRLVAMRTREFGIRIALGAKGRQVAALVARQTLRPVMWGVGLGLGGAFCVSGLLQAMIVLPDVPDLTYGAGAFDPLTLSGTLAAIAVTVAIAALAPVRRAVAVQPSVALRDD